MTRHAEIGIDRRPNTGRAGLCSVLLMIATVSVFWPAVSGSTSWDDSKTVFQNPHLTGAGSVG
ncbi:MAG: hypothetical protein ACREJC_03440, partial [Tepidisphaeraceae bacterium]